MSKVAGRGRRSSSPCHRLDIRNSAFSFCHSQPVIRNRPAGSKRRSHRPRLLQEVSSREDRVRRAAVCHADDLDDIKAQKSQNLGEVVGSLLHGGKVGVSLARDYDRLLSWREARFELWIYEGVHPVLHQLELPREEIEVYRRAEDDGVGLPYILQKPRDVVVDLALIGALAVVAPLASGVVQLVELVLLGQTARLFGPLQYLLDEPVDVTVLSWTSYDSYCFRGLFPPYFFRLTPSIIKF